MTSPDLKTIILLTGEAEADALGQYLLALNPALDIRPAIDRTSLDSACESLNGPSRLISFCSPVIVPKPYLDAMTCGAYNFHPGPPSYPGRYPSVFALYEGVTQFGVTFHEMVAKVDEGRIITAEWFSVPENCGLETLDRMAFSALVDLFRRLAARIATDGSKLKPKMIGWSGKKRSKADCEALCTLDDSLSADERALRTRVCGVHLKTD